jgi:hypothetical protein
VRKVWRPFECFSQACGHAELDFTTGAYHAARRDRRQIKAVSRPFSIKDRDVVVPALGAAGLQAGTEDEYFDPWGTAGPQLKSWWPLSQRAGLWQLVLDENWRMADRAYAVGCANCHGREGRDEGVLSGARTGRSADLLMETA